MKNILLEISLLTFCISTFCTSTYAQTSTFPYESTFDGGLDNWVNTDTKYQWVIDNGTNSRVTKTYGLDQVPVSGPEAPAQGSGFAYFDTENAVKNATATISQTFDFTNLKNPVISLYTHTFFNDTCQDIGEIALFKISVTYDESNYKPDEYTVWSNEGDKWNRRGYCLKSCAGYSDVKIDISVIAGSSQYCNFAIDDIIISDFTVQSTVTNASCYNYEDGEINISVDQAGTYKFSKDDGSTYTDAITSGSYTFTNLKSEIYNIVVQDQISKCKAVDNISISQPAKIDLEETHTDITCYNDNNGSVTLSASESTGSSTYSYSIYGKNGTFQSQPTFTGLSGGTYYAVAKNAAGCKSDSLPFEIGDQVLLKINSIRTVNIEKCYGDKTGEIEITAEFGTTNAPVNYSIDNGSNWNNYDKRFQGLEAGQYNVVIKDKNGCEIKWSNTITLTQPTKILYEGTIATDIEGCYGDQNGKLKAVVSGGTPDYQYSLNGVTNWQSSATFENLAAGSYTVYVTDANQCTTSGQSVTLIQPEKLIMDNAVVYDVTSCYGDATGKIQIIMNATQKGTGQLQYCAVNDGSYPWQTSSTLTGLKAGTYTPSVIDANNCRFEFGEVTISQPEKFQLVSHSTGGENLCYGDKDAVIFALANGGTAPYYFTINNWTSKNQTSSSILTAFSGLGAGTYTLKSKDAQGCTGEDATITLTQPEKLIINNVETVPVNCFEGKDGEIIITATGGTAPYVNFGYSETVDGTYNTFASNRLTGISSGMYYVKVTDKNNCQVTSDQAYNVSSPSSLQIYNVEYQNVESCHNDLTGKIKIDVSGGSTPYQYSINKGSTYQVSSEFSNLPASTEYKPYVIDSHGCVAEYTESGFENIIITQPSQLYILSQEYQNVQGCNGDANGIIDIRSRGGSAIHYYSVDGGSTYQTDSLFNNLTAGTYTVAVKDDHNCKVDGATMTIEQPSPMTLSGVETTDVSCYGNYEGTAVINVDGGQKIQSEFPYDFYINGEVNPSSHTGEITSLAAGTYNFIVKDMYKCEISGSFTITQPEKMVLTQKEYTDITTCANDKNGTATFLVTGGTGTINYNLSSYNYTAGNSTGKFENMPAGSYTMIAFDENQCRLETDMYLTEPDKLKFTAERRNEIECNGDNDGAFAFINMQGGTQPYSYSIDGINFDYTQPEFTNMRPGTYLLKMDDANHCGSTDSYTMLINEPALMQVFLKTFDISCNSGSDGQIIASSTGGTKPYSYSLNGGTPAETGSFSNLAEGTYTITVTDHYGCTAISEPADISRPVNKAGFSTDIDQGCSPLKVQIKQDYYGLTNYDFGNGDHLYNQTGSPYYTFVNETDAPVTYTITASLQLLSGEGCRDEATSTVTVYPQPKVEFILDNDSIEYPLLTATFANLCKNITTAQWDFGDGTTSTNISERSHDYPSCGKYHISLIASDGMCIDTCESDFTITTRNIYPAMTVDVKEGCMPLKVNFENITANADSVVWDFGDNSDPVKTYQTSHTYENAGDYYVTLIAYGDCGSQSSAVKKISVYQTPTSGFEQNKDTIYSGQYLRLDAASQNSDYYLWDFGDGSTSDEKNPMHKYEKSGFYKISLVVTTSEGSCVDTSTISNAVTVIDNPTVTFPNAFSPNNDGINDVFKPVHGEIAKFEMVILNRNGIIMYRGTDIDQGWDGNNHKGEKCPPDLYVYKAKTTLRDNSFTKQTGYVFLLR